MAALLQHPYVVKVLRFLLLGLMKLLRCDYGIENTSGFIDLLRVLGCHICFAFGRQQRFPTYDYSKPDPYNRGLLSRKEEEKLEFPVAEAFLGSEGQQELLLTGARTSGEILVIRFVHAQRRQAQINILLKDTRGRTFTTNGTGEKYLPLDISHGNKFQAGGLRMRCVEAMRKWRVAFNGLLINKETGETAYVRFTFLWFSLSDVLDWSRQVPAKRLMSFCLDSKADEKLSETIAHAEICRDYLNGFEQTGYMVGTLQVSIKGNQNAGTADPEQELHLRGNFLRIRHPIPSTTGALKLDGFTHNFTYSKKGHLLQLSSFKFSNGKSLVFGSFLSTPGFKDSVETILNEQGLEARLDDVLHSPTLKFTTFELSHEVLRSEGLTLSSYKSHLGWNNEIRISTFDALLDDTPAIGISLQGLFVGVCADDVCKSPINILNFDDVAIPAPFVVSLDDSQCKSCSLTGGKGASLAVLTALSNTEEENDKFCVPKGIVVTTAAFRRFMQCPAMYSMKNDLNEVLKADSIEDVKEITAKCMNAILRQRVPSSLSEGILEKLHEIFPDFSTKRFAVRSSCAGEDSEDMSAAGQMETFLGVKGEKQILQSILKCWASQLSHVAIEYKKSYGQELVSEMAVVIMEMVEADSAGVMFTCDPLTGDPSSIYITSNFGLGESVVSAMVDPDTVRVHRDFNGKLVVSEVSLGKKETKIVVDQAGDGTRVEDVTDKTSCSLSSPEAELLARVGVRIECCYGDWRDVEWAFGHGTLYILQARPLTFMDKPSDLEISTDFEVASRAETSCFSKANVGEVLNGAISPLAIQLMCRTIALEMMVQRGNSARLKRCALSPYSQPGLKIARYHFFLDVSESFRVFTPDLNNKSQVESLMLNIFGRIIDDEELYEEMSDKTDLPPRSPYWSMKLEIFRIKYLARPILHYNEYLAQKKTRYPKDDMDVEALFHGLLEAVNITMDNACFPHTNASNGSSYWTSRIVEYLQKVTDKSTEVIYGDISRLLASAEDVVSCGIPSDLKQLGQLISAEIGNEKFLGCSVEAAELLLKDEESYPKTAAGFRKCIEQFGHRGYNEFDIYRKTWDMDASPVISTLQATIRNPIDNAEKVRESIWKSMEGLECKLNFWQKLRLAVIVFFARRAVGTRENSKSLWIWTQNTTRKWAWALAFKMKQEGRLPNEELLFFCNVYELHELIHNRNPAIIARAIDRKRLFPELVDQEFREYFRGIPHTVPEPLPIFEDGIVQMKGFPISKGRVQAKARVINKLEDAVQIRGGEILITYATDIGWSPYFPLLGGVVTELGGLMSHGAVVAREYGLPCVVGLFGATKVFRSGDTVLLDGALGLLVRLEEAA